MSWSCWVGILPVIGRSGCFRSQKIDPWISLISSRLRNTLPQSSIVNSQHFSIDVEIVYHGDGDDDNDGDKITTSLQQYTVFQKKKLDPLSFHHIFALTATNCMKICNL